MLAEDPNSMTTSELVLVDDEDEGVACGTTMKNNSKRKNVIKEDGRCEW